MAEDLTSRVKAQLNELNMSTNCMANMTKSCSLQCGPKDVAISFEVRDISSSSAVAAVAEESRSCRVVQAGLREDEAEFAAVERREELTPAHVLPPILRGETSSDIESSDDNPARPGGATQRKGSGLTRHQERSASRRTYHVLEPPLNSAVHAIGTVAALLEYLSTLSSELCVNLEEINWLGANNVVTKDLEKGDIVYLESGRAGVGRIRERLSTVVVSAINSSDKSKIRTTSDFNNTAVKADCRLWKILDLPGVTQGTDRNCWGLWKLDIATLQNADEAERNCVACYLNCFLIIFATKTICRGESLKLRTQSSQADLRSVLVVEKKNKIGHFPAPTDCVGTVTTSASAETSPRSTSAGEQLSSLEQKVLALDLNALRESLKKWPRPKAVNDVWNCYSLFRELIELGENGGNDAQLDPLLFKMCEPIQLCRPSALQLLEAESAEAFIAHHKLDAVGGAIKPLYRTAASVHTCVDSLTQATKQDCNPPNKIE